MSAKLTTLSILALTGLLAACSPKAGADASASAATSETPTQAMSDMSGMTHMSGMAMPDTAKTGQGTGTITAINNSAGTVTIKHEAIPAVDWPAMTMAFKASPASLLESLKVGEKISFDVKVKGSDAEVTAVTPQ